MHQKNWKDLIRPKRLKSRKNPPHPSMENSWPSPWRGVRTYDWQLSPADPPFLSAGASIASVKIDGVLHEFRRFPVSKRM